MSRYLLLVLFGIALMAQTPDANGVYQVGRGIKPPRVAFKTEPSYGEEARKAKVNGTVVLSLVIGTDGVPSDLKVVRGIGFGLDEKAVETVATWRFEPGQKGDEAVKVRASIEVNFRILDRERDNEQVRLSFSGAGPRPELIKGTMPPTPAGHLKVGLTVTPKGEATNLNVLEADDKAAADPVLKEMRGWRFRGAEHDMDGVFEISSGPMPRPSLPQLGTPPPAAPNSFPILPAPAILSPAEGAALDASPRKATLQWQPLQDAGAYYVECEAINGSEWTSVLAGRGIMVKVTELAFDFPGAQPGRCRVSSVNRGGQVSQPSAWRSFHFTR